MSFDLGQNGKCYRNTGSYASPTWVEMTNIRDLDIDMTPKEADVSTRGNAGWEAVVATQRALTVTFDMVWDDADGSFQALRDAFLTNGTIEFLVLNGSISTTGKNGPRATMMVTGFKRSEKLTEAIMASITLKNTYSANAPSWFTAP